MKIDFSTRIRSIDGNPIKMDKAGQPEFTLRDVAVKSLLTDGPEAAKLDGVEKFRRFRLADRIFGAAEPISLTAEEVTLPKELTGRTYGTLAAGRAWSILEGEDALPAGA